MNFCKKLIWIKSVKFSFHNFFNWSFVFLFGFTFNSKLNVLKIIILRLCREDSVPERRSVRLLHKRRLDVQAPARPSKQRGLQIAKPRVNRASDAHVPRRLRCINHSGDTLLLVTERVLADEGHLERDVHAGYKSVEEFAQRRPLDAHIQRAEPVSPCFSSPTRDLEMKYLYEYNHHTL